MKRHGYFILCLLVLGAIETYSYPQEEQPSNFENHEELEGEDSDPHSYYDDENDEAGERMKRDLRRMGPNQLRPQRVLQETEDARILNIVYRLMAVTRYYETRLRLSHNDAVNRMLAENPNGAYQVFMYVERYRHLPSLPIASL